MLDIHRSWAYYRRRPARPRGPRRPDVVAAIQHVVQTRPATYGYRRIHALLRRRGVRCNPKTVHALLRRHGWLSSARRALRRPGRRHEGQVAVAEPNRRWASDITSLTSWDGTKLRLLVWLDCADRSVLAWRAAPRITADDLCEVLREALWHRFGGELGRARGLECLSDNGPEYASQRFRACVEALGLVACRTPCRSPQSNGLAEAFFGSFKRDYVWQAVLETREDIMRSLPGWIRDYNEVAPHSALGMAAPAQFYAARSAKVQDGVVLK